MRGLGEAVETCVGCVDESFWEGLACCLEGSGANTMNQLENKLSKQLCLRYVDLALDLQTS